MKNKCEKIQRDTNESIRRFQQSEENKAVTLDQQLKEQQARLILERHVTEDKEISRLQLQKEVDVLKNRQQVLIEENNLLSMKIQNFEQDRLRYENDLSSLKSTSDQRQEEIIKLIEKVSELDVLKFQLQQCVFLIFTFETFIKITKNSFQKTTKFIVERNGKYQIESHE